MVLRTKDEIQYDIRGPLMNQSVPSLKVQAPGLPDVVGIDGRFPGGLRHYYGNKLVVDLVTSVGSPFTSAAMNAGNGVDWFKPVHFYLQGTTTLVDGFVVRWDGQNDTSDLDVTLVYTLSTAPTTWLSLTVFTGADIGLDDDIEVETWREFLYVTVAGQAPKVVYCPSAGSMQAKTMGCGVFAAELGTATRVSEAKAAGYYLKGDGVYQVAYRLYDSTRNIYSGLSARLTVTLDTDQLSKASGYFALNAGGGDSGKLVDGDTLTVGSIVYEADSNSSVTPGRVAIPISGVTTVAGMCAAIANAINGDSSQTLASAKASATSVTIEAKDGGAGGNAIALAKSETGANTTDVSVSGATLSGGGVPLSGTAEEQCKVTVQLPANTAVVAGQGYSDIAAMFDTVDIFRSINLGQGATTTGAVLWLERSVTLPASSGAWDAYTFDVGTMHDDSLPFSTMYNPETDTITAPPQSGAILRYQELTFMPSAPNSNGGRDIWFSSFDHASPEYFSTYNKREGCTSVGRIRKLLSAGDSVFALGATGLTHVYKAAGDRPLQIVDLHRGRGIPGIGGAHAVGNSVLLATACGLMLMNGNDGNMGQISAVDRVLMQAWSADMGQISGGFDATLNASILLDPVRYEALLVWHGTQTTGRWEGAPFTWCTDGLDMARGNWRVFLVTKRGRIVSPDADSSGTGTMNGLATGLTLNGAVTSSTSTTLTMTGATFDATMVGAYVYATSGDYQGLGQLITAASGTQLTFASFGGALPVGTTFAVSPVVSRVRFSRLRDPDPNLSGDEFRRWVVVGMAVQFVEVEGFTNNASNQVYIGVYRHGSVSKQTGTGGVTSFAMTDNPAEAVGALKVDGVGVEPWVEQIASGVKFELTGLEVSVKMTDSKAVIA